MKLTIDNLSGIRTHVLAYIRWSSLNQSEGDSEARQRRSINLAAKRANLEIDEWLIDDGKSASKGHHLTKGEFGKLLERAESGELPKNSIIIIDTHHRFSRLGEVIAVSLRSRFIAAGCILYFAEDNMVVDEHFLTSGDMFGHRGGMYAKDNEASVYSQNISRNLKSAWQRTFLRAWKRDCIQNNKELPSILQSDEIGTTLNGNLVPRWLKLDESGVLVPIEERVEMIKYIYQLYEEEGMGLRTITARINKEGHPFWASHIKKNRNAWTMPNVSSVLSDRRLLGFYTPDEGILTTFRETHFGIEPPSEMKLYPEVIDPGLFASVQQLRKSKRMIKVGSRVQKHKSLFAGLIFCGECGEGVKVADSGDNRRGIRYRCSGRRQLINDCQNGRTIRADHCETILVAALIERLPEWIFTEEEKKDMDSLRHRAAKHAEVIDKAKKKRKNLMTLLDDDDDDLLDAINSLKALIAKETEELKVLEYELAKYSDTNPTETKADLEQLFQNYDENTKNSDYRDKVNQKLRKYGLSLIYMPDRLDHDAIDLCIRGKRVATVDLRVVYGGIIGTINANNGSFVYESIRT